jgi:hypothetical protein
MTGMHRSTGKTLSGEAHIAQSIGDILSTPLGTRTMRREYGSRLADLIDAPMNALTRLLIIAATAGAIRRWEPRIALDKVEVSGGTSSGSLGVTLTGHRTDIPAPAPIQLNIAL